MLGTFLIQKLMEELLKPIQINTQVLIKVVILALILMLSLRQRPLKHRGSPACLGGHPSTTWDTAVAHKQTESTHSNITLKLTKRTRQVLNTLKQNIKKVFSSCAVPGIW